MPPLLRQREAELAFAADAMWPEKVPGRWQWFDSNHTIKRALKSASHEGSDKTKPEGKDINVQMVGIDHVLVMLGRANLQVAVLSPAVCPSVRPSLHNIFELPIFLSF